MSTYVTLCLLESSVKLIPKSHRFAGLPDSTTAEIDHMSFWTLYRNAVTEMKPEPSFRKNRSYSETVSELPAEHDRDENVRVCAPLAVRLHRADVEQYEAATVPSWPACWTEEVRLSHWSCTKLTSLQGNLPAVRPELEYLRSELFRLYGIRKAEKDFIPVLMMTNEVQIAHLKDRFQDILQIVHEAIQLKAARKKLKIPETTVRTMFDRFTKMFYCNDSSVRDDNGSKRVFTYVVCPRVLPK